MKQGGASGLFSSVSSDFTYVHSCSSCLINFIERKLLRLYTNNFMLLLSVQLPVVKENEGVSGSTESDLWVWYERTNFPMTYEVKCKLLDGKGTDNPKFYK